MKTHFCEKLLKLETPLEVTAFLEERFRNNSTYLIHEIEVEP